jgi:alpha-ketoglutarate-dependent taurine dioxygenase
MQYVPLTAMDELHRKGYIFLPKLDPDCSSLEVAKSLGPVVDLQKAYPGQGLQTVHPLRALKENESKPNTYSAILGLREFPPHTDFANWSSPPRFIMLRCLVGHESVFTTIFSGQMLLSCLGDNTSRRALFRPRRKVLAKPMTILPMCFSMQGSQAIRWDPRFLRPINQEAAAAVSKAAMLVNLQKPTARVQLSSRGDTIIIDNWRCLHGRSQIGAEAVNRRLERVLLDDVKL